MHQTDHGSFVFRKNREVCSDLLYFAALPSGSFTFESDAGRMVVEKLQTTIRLDDDSEGYLEVDLDASDTRFELLDGQDASPNDELVILRSFLGEETDLSPTVFYQNEVV